MWRASDWQGAKVHDVHSVAPLAADGVLEARSWFESSHVATSQIGPSCVGMSVANWVEHMLGQRLAKHLQIDGHKIWRRGRDMFWGGTYNDGLYVEQGVAAAVDLGIIPKAKAVPVLSVGAWNQALAKQPLLQAHWVHQGWEKPNPENGCLDHQYGKTTNQGGHATLMIGMGSQAGKWFLMSQNSWGSTWGKLGFFTMTVDEHLENSAGDVLAIELDWDEWAQWLGWKAFVV